MKNYLLETFNYIVLILFGILAIWSAEIDSHINKHEAMLSGFLGAISIILIQKLVIKLLEKINFFKEKEVK